MIVEDFLRWAETAPAQQRAEAAGTVARAYLYSDVSPEVREALEAAIILLIDDSSPLVRFALADALSNSPDAPRHAILMLASDRPDIASLVLSRSPIFLDSELVDIAAAAADSLQVAIASRLAVSSAVSAAIAEVGCLEACRRLAANDGAMLARISLRRMADRFGGDGTLREYLLGRPDLPVDMRQRLIRLLGDALSDLVSARGWVDGQRAQAMTRDACDRATVSIAAETESEDLPALVEHLRVTGQLTTSLLLRAVCAGNVAFFGHALASLAGVPQPRVEGLLSAGRASAFRAVYARARLPMVAFNAFAVAIDTQREWDLSVVDAGERYRFVRRMVETVIARYERITDSEMNELMAMLRRFAADAARAAAREYAGSIGRAA